MIINTCRVKNNDPLSQLAPSVTYTVILQPLPHRAGIKPECFQPPEKSSSWFNTCTPILGANFLGAEVNVICKKEWYMLRQLPILPLDSQSITTLGN